MNPETVAHTANASTGVDSLASIVVIAIVAISVLTLLGMGAMMAINAVFSNRPLVTSWPAEQEAAFAAFERRGSAASSQAWVVSLIGAAIVTFVAVGVYFGVSPEKKDMTKGMNMSNISTRKTGAAQTAPAAAESPKPDSPAPAEAPAPKP